MVTPVSLQETIDKYLKAGLPIEQAIFKAHKDLREPERTLEKLENYWTHLANLATDWRG